MENGKQSNKIIMKATILVSAGPYGFGKTWTLQVETKTRTKQFFLGQDVKVCSRLLQMDSRSVVQAIGTNVLDDRGCKKLAKFILSTIKERHLITTAKLMNMEPWALAVE
jgi:hypothetical protein